MNTTPDAPLCDQGIALDDPAAAAAAAAPPRPGEDWASRARVRSLVRELRRPSLASAGPAIRLPHGRHRFDPPQDLFDQFVHPATATVAPIAPQPTAAALLRSRRTEGSQITAWLIVITGALALVAGLVMIGWSIWAEQTISWNMALGLTLGGQGMLILGLVLVVSRLWRSSRHAATKLQDVHARLGQLQYTADSLLAMRSGGAPAFYADLVRGASPQVLLANLKGQVDQLARRLGGGW